MNHDAPIERTTVARIDYLGTARQQADYRQLAVWCLKAAYLGLHEDADLLFDAWRQTVQPHDQWKCEQHFLNATAAGGRPEWGIVRMQAALERDPDDELAYVGLGTAMLLGGLPGWREPLDFVLARSTDQYVRRSALRCIEVVAPPRLRALAARSAGPR